MIFQTKLTLVIPCYNEELALPETIKSLLNILDDLIKKQKISIESFMLLVDDGSSDKSWEIISTQAKNNMFIKGIKFSRNRGHQIALFAGMEYVIDKCACMISLDADLQDDPSVIESMIDAYNIDSCEIVYGIRKQREVDTFFKKITALGFYKAMQIMGVNLIYNHADYRLLSKKALSFLSKFEERNLFLRGLIPFIGLKTGKVYYNRKERFAGDSKYPLKKMLIFAWEGITSFSIIPIRLISIFGLIIFLVCDIMILYILYVYLFTNNTVPGWVSTVLPIYFIGGIQLLSIGIIGEYVGKTYLETKKRPRYFIDKETDIGKN